MKKIVSFIGSLGVFLMVFMMACQETTSDTNEDDKAVDPSDVSLSLEGGHDFVKNLIITELDGAVLTIPQVMASGYRLSYSLEEVMLGDEIVMEYPFALGTGDNAGKVVFVSNAMSLVRGVDLPAMYTLTMILNGTNNDKDKVSTTLTLRINIVEPSSLSLDFDGGTDLVKTCVLDEDLDGAMFGIPQMVVLGYDLTYRISRVTLTLSGVRTTITSADYPFVLGSGMDMGTIIFASNAVEQLTMMNIDPPATYTIEIEGVGTNSDKDELTNNLMLTVNLVDRKEIPRPIFSPSQGVSTFYMFQTNSADQGVMVEHTIGVTASAVLPEARLSVALEDGQSILYEVVTDSVIVEGYFEIDQVTREMTIKPVAYGLFDPRMNSSLVAGMHIPVAIRAYLAHDHDSDAETPIEPIDNTFYSEFVMTLSVKGPRIEFATNAMTGTVHLNCRCAGEMGLAGSALTDYYIDRGTINVVINGVLSALRVPTDSAPLADVLAGRIIGFEVLTNGHADLPAGESTLVRDGYFEVTRSTSMTGTLGANYALRILSPMAHALWASTPSSIDSAITDMASTGDTRDIFVKVLVGVGDYNTGMPIDATVFDILKLTVTVGSEM